jgi:hypothetical protein
MGLKCAEETTQIVLSPIRNSVKHIKLFSTHLPISRSLQANSERYLRQTPVFRLACSHFPWRLNLVKSSLFRDVTQLGLELVTEVPGQRVGPIFEDLAWHFQTWKINCPVTSVTNQQPTQHNIPERTKTSTTPRRKVCKSHCVSLYSVQTRKQNVTP